jgi:NADH-quinone oxidoreductase subunit H
MAAVAWAALWALMTCGFIALATLILVWAERKIAGRIQWRHGPLHTGWHGLLQTLADTLKLLLKEDIVNAAADRFLFLLAPFVTFVPAAMAYMVLPLEGKVAIRDLNVGVLYFLAVPSIGVVGLLMAGWGSYNNFSLMGGLRSAAQMISYEVPRSLAVLSVVVLAGSLSLSDVVAAQSGHWYGPWFALLLIPGFLTYLVTSIAEVNRTPFDIPEAESELVGGFHTEYAGLRWSLFMMAEYANVVASSAFGAVIFLGGPTGPWLPGWLWLLIKTSAIVVFMMWMRWTLPRFRSDQLMDISWRFFIPVAVANLALAAMWAVVLPSGVLPS